MNFANYFNFNNNSITYGLTNELIAFYLLELFKSKKQNIILVTSNMYESNNIYKAISSLTDDAELFPMDDFVSSIVLASSPEFKIQRLNVLDKIKINNKIIITSLTGYLKYLPNQKEVHNIDLGINKNISRDSLIDDLNKLGYKKESLVTTTGEYSVRGFIIDIYPIDEAHPIRVEFFDNFIDNIRYFDENTQRTIDKIKHITLKPFDEIKTSCYNSLYDYTNAIVVYLNKDELNLVYEKLANELLEYQKIDNNTTNIMFELNDINPYYELYLDNINNMDQDVAKPMIHFNENLELLKNNINNWTREGKQIYFYVTSQKVVKELKKMFTDITVISKNLTQGFIYKDIVCICENDISTHMSNTYKLNKNIHIGKKIKDYNDLSIGDYVVHINHGIGVYNGIINLTKNGMQKDYIQLIYADNGKIYIPVEKINSIYKYSSKDGSVPKLNKLDSTSWEKTKRYIQKKAEDISKELMELYAKRASIKSIAYKSFPEEQIFASNFSYTPTKDQLRAINEINNDLESTIPMDRLLCGDVGFGKTEVAMRGIYKAVLNNAQVMYLCPTTILSKQQYKVICERFKEEPVEIRLLNRFSTSNEVKEILEGFNSGKIDILVGTHRILSDDVRPSKLGMLVVDEEQRFGVKHKEKIKEYKNDVNVLTLSATPIPRTLKMSLSGLRDLSVIDTPPLNRYPVQTYVVRENDLIVKDAMYKELMRNGQVFILYNRVDRLDLLADKINSLVPEAKIRCAHGQMSKEDLDEIMDDFVNGLFNVLICTTIIENGIDIANANTLIVYDADNFGLSQLYQIRGRVGRSDRIAYAYLLYDTKKILNADAVKRLNAIKEFTELGSGYKVAMRDLAIRGSGDIFGSDQAGFVDTVGINLYMKFIDDEIKKLKGEYVEDDTDDNNLIEVSTHIKDEYVDDDNIKIEIHQKINEINSLESLELVKEELIDRFGKIDEDMQIYMYEEWFSNICKDLGITDVNKTDRYIEISLPEMLSSSLDGEKLLFETMSICTNFNISYHNRKIIFKLFYKNLSKHYIYYLVDLVNIIKEN